MEGLELLLVFRRGRRASSDRIVREIQCARGPGRILDRSAERNRKSPPP